MGRKQRPSQFALTSGGLAFFILLTLLQELDKTRTDNPPGCLVGSAFLVGLFLLRKIKRQIYSNMWFEKRARLGT